MESQILRTASHIGYRFMAETLIGVLSPNLKGHLFDALDSLVKQRWLLFDSAESGVYCFAHKHARQVVYYVIPQSERDKLHRAIAAYTERVGADDPAQFLDIAQHFSHFDGVKTFEYTVRAAHHMMWQTPPLLKAALGTLGTALSYASWKMEIELLPALLKAVLALAGQESHLVGLRNTRPAARAEPALRKREAARGVSCGCGLSFRIFNKKVRPAPKPSSVRSVPRSVAGTGAVLSVCSAGALGRVMLIAYSLQSEVRRAAAVLAQAQDQVDCEGKEGEQVGRSTRPAWLA
mmetsp:Transcript_22219/g.49436  ORF Transcript_22219/g.49436 Transcript_22219/m.49436 type:complete len:292 (-) Transcript_22219:68-943(-)